MQHTKNIMLGLCINFTIVVSSYCQNNEYDTVVKTIANKVEKFMNHKYYISGIDIGKSLNNPRVSDGKIIDPYHTLSDCFLFLAEGQGSESRGFIGLYKIKTDSIIWRSVLLTYNFSSGARGRVAETRELNKDKKVEIIIGQAGGSTGNVELFWIFNWDGTNGKLITQTDKYGQSMIVVSGDYYEIKDVDGDGIYEIIGQDPDSDKTLTYSWNGSLYGDWGKSSKYLLKGKRK